MSNDPQLLHLVIGGELTEIGPDARQFKDITKVEFVGAFPSYEEARGAWRASAQRTVDNAHMRFFIIHAHKLLDPSSAK